eukprot:UN06978
MYHNRNLNNLNLNNNHLNNNPHIRNQYNQFPNQVNPHNNWVQNPQNISNIQQPQQTQQSYPISQPSMVTSPYQNVGMVQRIPPNNNNTTQNSNILPQFPPQAEVSMPDVSISMPAPLDDLFEATDPTNIPSDDLEDDLDENLNTSTEYDEIDTNQSNNHHNNNEPQILGETKTSNYINNSNIMTETTNNIGYNNNHQNFNNSKLNSNINNLYLENDQNPDVINKPSKLDHAFAMNNQRIQQHSPSSSSSGSMNHSMSHQRSSPGLFGHSSSPTTPSSGLKRTISDSENSEQGGSQKKKKEKGIPI